MMRKYFLVFIALTLLAGAGCKKDKQPAENPPAGSTKKKWIVSTIAGQGSGGFANGPALSAKFNAPIDVAVAADGTLYVADFKNHRIRKIVAGQVSTFAGSDSFGIVNGNGSLARFANPYRIALDAGNNLYVLDEEDIHVRKISPAATVSFYAGTGKAGFLDGDASIAEFQWNASGITTDIQGNVYVADNINQRIRKISTPRQVTTIAGDGTAGLRDGDARAAWFSYPDGIAFDQQGYLYVADVGNLCIRKITPGGIVSRFAGSGTNGNADGGAATAQFNFISDMVADSKGNLYVIDENRVRQVTPQGAVTTIAGNTAGYGFVDGNGDTARFAGLAGLGVDAEGNIFVADINNNRVRKISFE